MDSLFYQIKFGCSSGGNIDKIIWAHEPDIPEGEVFIKKSQKHCKGIPFCPVPLPRKREKETS